MCLPDSPPPPPPPLPAQAPPQIVKLEGAEGSTSATNAALSANRGRSSLRIDRTQNTVGSAGTGLSIPT